MVTLIPIGAIGGGGGTSGPVTSDDITDATTVGKALVKAVDAPTARSAIGAGTGSSNLAIGSTSTTAMAGNKTAADLGGVLTTRTIAGQALSSDVGANALATALGVASTSQKGTVALATNTQAQTGTDAALAITAASMAATQRPLFVTLNPYWPLNWVAGTGWPARTTIPQWYRDLGGLARYVADSPTLVAGSVTLPSDKQDKDRIYVLPGLIPGT